jgi:hypothetical protein
MSGMRPGGPTAPQDLSRTTGFAASSGQDTKIWHIGEMLGIDHRLEGLRKLDPDRAERLGRQIVAMLDAEAAYETQRQEAVCRAFSSFDQGSPSNSIAAATK